MTRRRFVFLTVTLAALAVSLSWLSAVGTAEQKTLHSAIKPVPRGDWVLRHHRMNEQVKQGNVDLIFIGDSITHAWETVGKEAWKQYYGNRNAVNLGIGGDRTQHVLWRLDNGNIEGISPKLAVLMIGTNNSGENTPDEIAEGITLIVKTLRERLPKTKVLILGIFPCGPDDKDPRRQVNTRTNQIVAKLADGRMIRYLDIGKEFLEPDGTLTRQTMPDLLHLTPKSYRIWAEAIEPAVSKMVGPK